MARRGTLMVDYEKKLNQACLELSASLGTDIALMQAYSRAFAEMDEQHVGVLDTMELGRLLERVDKPKNFLQLRKTLKKIDPDSTGKLTFNQIAGLLVDEGVEVEDCPAVKVVPSLPGDEYEASASAAAAPSASPAKAKAAPKATAKAAARPSPAPAAAAAAPASAGDSSVVSDLRQQVQDLKAESAALLARAEAAEAAAKAAGSVPPADDDRIAKLEALLAAEKARADAAEAQAEEAQAEAAAATAAAAAAAAAAGEGAAEATVPAAELAAALARAEAAEAAAAAAEAAAAAAEAAAAAAEAEKVEKSEDASKGDEESKSDAADVQSAAETMLPMLWDIFDKDGDGTLSEFEIHLLLQQYLELCRSWTPKVFERSLQLGLPLVYTELQAVTTDAAVQSLLPLAVQGVQQVLTELQAGMLEQTKDMLNMLLERSSLIARRLLMVVDTDGSGEVDRDEFLQNFLPAIQRFTSPAMIERLSREEAAAAPEPVVSK